MNLVQYIGFRLDEAIEMLLSGKSNDECACYLIDFKKQLFGRDDVIIDEDKGKYLPYNE